MVLEATHTLHQFPVGLSHFLQKRMPSESFERCCNHITFPHLGDLPNMTQMLLNFMQQAVWVIFLGLFFILFFDFEELFMENREMFYPLNLKALYLLKPHFFKRASGHHS